MHDQLQAAHCAAQTYHGLLSLVVLKRSFLVDWNARSSKQATCLHFAVMYKELKNVEFLAS